MVCSIPNRGTSKGNADKRVVFPVPAPDCARASEKLARRELLRLDSSPFTEAKKNAHDMKPSALTATKTMALEVVEAPCKLLPTTWAFCTKAAGKWLHVEFPWKEKLRRAAEAMDELIAAIRSSNETDEFLAEEKLCCAAEAADELLASNRSSNEADAWTPEGVANATVPW